MAEYMHRISKETGSDSSSRYGRSLNTQRPGSRQETNNVQQGVSSGHGIPGTLRPPSANRQRPPSASRNPYIGDSRPSSGSRPQSVGRSDSRSNGNGSNILLYSSSSSVLNKTAPLQRLQEPTGVLGRSNVLNRPSTSGGFIPPSAAVPLSQKLAQTKAVYDSARVNQSLDSLLKSGIRPNRNEIQEAIQQQQQQQQQQK
uniref:Uncharacterized protein n=1 Tax=Polytomella parva TaxID=51329 RepID=A0A7S0UWG8_9CHLO|mmetsp:Transcript_16532/g.29898  ORF Transcript_16532/g.29898 Transcript_16532/m.29898 type:complete len:200 (+) Transcript_16532:130-729(+)